jgi:hypothetical protein
MCLAKRGWDYAGNRHPVGVRLPNRASPHDLPEYALSGLLYVRALTPSYSFITSYSFIN